MGDNGSCGVPGVRRGREAELVAEGWERRTVADEPRLSELAEQYRSLGFEVQLEKFIPENDCGRECTVCFSDPKMADRFRVIYTRTGGASQDE